ncbi:methyltransferase [Kordiimonas sediminis]|uniref:Methyltransferase n=1 Tax=Kordiimonas sediminis TaxID=1735581 RepID=A0A919AXI0_9PROT|nr:class I SAM-dependent methyltransferase [Kordiimonas sediminis]GHF29607.1 methyltransferase [Kordiimonas sediminis]
MLGKRLIIAGLMASAGALSVPSVMPLFAEDAQTIEQAISSAERPDTDRARDADRKPSEVLSFFGVEEGQTILDLFSGGGYYTELLSRIVGPNGKVTAHNNAAYLSFAKNDLKTRYENGRLANVQSLIAEADDIHLAPDSLDFVMMTLTFHDLYYHSENWPEIDADRLLSELFKGLKPGGVVGIIDHSAKTGAPLELTANQLHRIDAGKVITIMTGHGFVLVDESDVLRNPDDPLTISMFDASIRGKTDRFVMKFKKPE